LNVSRLFIFIYQNLVPRTGTDSIALAHDPHSSSDFFGAVAEVDGVRPTGKWHTEKRVILIQLPPYGVFPLSGRRTMARYAKEPDFGPLKKLSPIVTGV